MAINPSYNAPDQTDFSDQAHLRHILCRDKRTRIEGLCSEAAFMEDVIKGNFDPVTFDFWFSRWNDSYHIRKIVTDPSTPLNELDYAILDLFAGITPPVPVSVVYFDEVAKTFLQFTHTSGGRYKNFTGTGSIMPQAAHPWQAPDATRNPARLSRACDFLEQLGLLRDAAIKRLFANCWLGEAVWDIDVFTRTAAGRIIAFEVKQKFPTKAGTYGVNAGQKKLFDFLTTCEIPVIHVILKKPDCGGNLIATDLLTMEEHIRNTEWIYTRFGEAPMWPASAPAPSATSIAGHTEVPYYHIDTRSFSLLKKYRQPAADIR